MSAPVAPVHERPLVAGDSRQSTHGTVFGGPIRRAVLIIQSCLELSPTNFVSRLPDERSPS